MRKIYKMFLHFILLMALWVFLSGVFKPVQVVSGILSIIAIIIFLNSFSRNHLGWNVKISRYIIYQIWLASEIFKSSISVSIAIISGKINPTIVYMPHKLKSKHAISLLTHSITLTPGSIAIDENHKFIIVHSLFDVNNLEEFNKEMNDKVAKLEKLEIEK